jgi:glycosyltransferase involved in cell wall biosynthesis
MRKVRNQLSSRIAEASLWLAARADPAGHRPRLLFFPSGEREGASLLRAYNIAGALGSLGWLTGTVPGTVNLAGRERIIRRFQPDLLVFQQCRHPLNDGDLAFGIPYVIDTDDADFHLEIPGLAERLERTVRGARGVIAGSRYIRDHHKSSNPNVAVIWTGTPISDCAWPSHSEREAKGPPIVAWAQARPVDYDKELEFVAEIDRRLRAKECHHRLRLYGVDTETDRLELARRFGPDCLLEFMPTLGYAEFLKSLRDVSVGLCPLISDSPFSRGKSFGKILAYLAAGVPVIASDAADHALLFDAESGIVSNDSATWARAAQELLADPLKRDRMADHAGILLHERLSLDASSALTDRFLRKLMYEP